MQIIPLQSKPAQQVAAQLGDQTVQLVIKQKSTGLFLDLYINNALILGGVLCEDRNRIVRSAYLGFAGDLAFIDNQGTSDPVYSGLGSRFSLAYLEPGDL